ncbi:MAG: hypothetical protein WC375_03585 [Methanomassiliicoccales archaeon]|jgi:hypothetical protein
MIYWLAKLQNGLTIDETTHPWPPEGAGIVSLSLILQNGREIKLPDGMDQYVQAKNASADLGSGKITIESRYIGFVSGNKVTRIRVSESTGNISVELNEI